MAALLGFDAATATETITAPVTLAQLLASKILRAGYAVGGLDLTAPALDPGGTLAVTVGDPTDTDRLLTANTVAQDGGLVEWRPDPLDWYRYGAQTTVSVRVSTGPVAAVSDGTFTLTLYTYPAATLATAQAMVLEELGILKEDGIARAEEQAQAARVLTEVHDELQALGLGNRQDLAWPIELIPTWAVRHVARMGAAKLMGVFGIPMPRRQLLMAGAQMAEREMRRQTRVATAGGPVAATYY